MPRQKTLKATPQLKPIRTRIKLKLSQHAYAELLGTTQSTVSKWERGEVDVPAMVEFFNILLLNDPSNALLLMKHQKTLKAARLSQQAKELREESRAA
jgi:DNA-binding transcriptional regulator YiaG